MKLKKEAKGKKTKLNEQIGSEEHVSIGTRNEVIHWCSRLDCTVNELIITVLTVGSNVSAITDYIIKTRAMPAHERNFKLGLEEPSTIDVTSGWELNYWSYKLNCTHEELIAAEKEVGNRISKIKESIALTRKGSKM